jgi:hypothetical protein
MSTDIIDALQGKEKGDVVNVKVQSNGKILDRKVRLRNAVNSQNLTDNFSAFTALGISTIEKIEGGEFNGCYLLRVKDKETYEDSRRIYYASDLISYAKTLNVGETLTFYYSKSGSDRFEQTVEITKDFSTLSDSEIFKTGYVGSAAVVFMDYPLAAQKVQTEIYGESNIVLDENRAKVFDFATRLD